MRNTHFFTVLTVGCLLPFSLSAQSVTLEVPQPAIKVTALLPLEFHLPSVFPMTLDDSDRDLPVQEEETIQKSFSMAGVQHKSLEIDNVWGSIEVVGTNSDQAQFTVKKSVRAESKEKLEQARKEVTLDITEQAGSLKLYVNGPFRCNCDDGCGRREFEGYIVKMDFRFRVPRDIDIKVKTVNEGRVPVRAIQEEHHGAKVVFHADRYTGVRVNSGGPEINVENLNGEIRILENHE